MVNSYIDVEILLNDGLTKRITITNFNFLLDRMLKYEINYINISFTYQHMNNSQSYSLHR